MEIAVDEMAAKQVFTTMLNHAMNGSFVSVVDLHADLRNGVSMSMSIHVTLRKTPISSVIRTANVG